MCWSSGLEGAYNACGGAEIGSSGVSTTLIEAYTCFDPDFLTYLLAEISILLLMSFSSVFLSTFTIVSKALMIGCYDP